MIRLLELSLQNFRGFGPAYDKIKLDADLTLIFGPNGFGKTSIAEAIEWLFYGATKRRQHGEAFSKTEYAGCYANIHGGNPTQVEALVELDGKEIRLGRRLTPGDGSITLVDGFEANFSSVGIVPVEAFYPVVAQHSLQSFIHSKPKDRRDAICAALGLDELTDFKTALESARASFQRSPPSSITTARVELSRLAAQLSTIAPTASLGTRWIERNFQVSSSDVSSLLLAAEAVTGQPCLTTEIAIETLREASRRARRAIFNADPLYPSEDLTPRVAAYHQKADSMSNAFTNVERAIAVVSASMTATYSTLILEFWRVGLELAPDGVICPMCEAETLDADRREKIRQRLQAGKAVIASNAALAGVLQTTKLAIQALGSAVRDLGVSGLDASGEARLRELFTHAPEQATAFLARHAEWQLAKEELERAQIQLTNFIDICSEKIKIPENVPIIVTEAANLKDQLLSASSALVTPFVDYIQAWLSFKERLLERITSTDLVSRIDAVGQALAREAKINLLIKYDDHLSEAQELIRAVEGKIRDTQKAILETRGAEVSKYYKLLSGDAEVGFSKMEPATDNIKLHAVSYGRRMPAAANLSECQLNCLGLSVWLMRANSPSSPFGFILLDDPVQSMDDVHHEAFIISIVPYLLDSCGKQVIVLSHTKSVTKRLQDLNPERHVRSYHLADYERRGPVVTEQIGLAMLLADVKAGAKGGEKHRQYAVDRLRVLVEHFIRELHIKKLGRPAPATYDRAQPKDLLPLFGTIPDTTPQELAGLRDTCKFADPEHHTEVGYTTPVRANIDPHINRLEQLMKKYSLV